jgi:hypothetical protein
MGEPLRSRLTTFKFTQIFLIEQALRVYDFPLATRLEGLFPCLKFLN